MTDLLTQMKAEHPRAFAQRTAELRKQGADEISTTMDRLQMNPEPAPNRRYVGDSGITAGQDWRTVGEDEEDDDDTSRQGTKRPRDVRAQMMGEGDAAVKAEVNAQLGGDVVVLAKEERIFAIDKELGEVRDYETGSPAARSAVRKSARSLRQERGELANEIQVRKSVGTRNSIAKHNANPSEGVMFVGKLPRPKPFGLHG